MNYTLEGSAEGFARLNELRSQAGKSLKSGEDTLGYFRAYEEFLFPDSEEQRSKPDEMLEKNANDNRYLGHLATLTDKEIQLFSELSIKDRAKSLIPLKRFSNFGSTVYNDNKSKLFEVVDTLLSRVEHDVSERIGGPFAVVRVNRLVTRAGASDKSAKWHFDPVPCGFFKIFAYLNGPETHDGATDFLDGQVSSDLLANGYHLLPAENRASEIEDLPCNAKGELSQIRQKGEVYLFNPALTVHRGHYPSYGRRDVFEISILKSPVHWRESFDNLYSLAKMSGNPSFATWPRWVVRALT